MFVCLFVYLIIEYWSLNYNFGGTDVKAVMRFETNDQSNGRGDSNSL